MTTFANLQDGISADAALVAFRDGCNKGADRLFITDSWFADRERRLRVHLPAFLTAEIAEALRDAVMKTRSIDIVIDWLEHGAPPWPEYETWRVEENRRLAIERMREGYFPWEDVEACRGRNGKSERPLKEAYPCPQCHTTGDRLTWIHFSSPAWTWQHLCGREGWLTVCDSCRLQVQFFLEIMN